MSIAAWTRGTESRSVAEALALQDMRAQIADPLRRFTADGAYDQRSLYDRTGTAETEDVAIVIPPRRLEVSSGPTDDLELREWQTESRYHRWRGWRTGFPIQVHARRTAEGKERYDAM